VVSGCGSEPEARAPERAVASSKPVTFLYGTPRGEEFGSATTRGRVTAILFVTTYDFPSQIMARRLDAVMRRHRPRANAGAVVLEEPDHAPFAEVFRTTLDLGYPVAMTTSYGVQDSGPFGVIDKIPTLVVLDRDGREVTRLFGNLDEEAIEEALERAESR
jgi:hypothetical protein